MSGKTAAARGRKPKSQTGSGVSTPKGTRKGKGAASKKPTKPPAKPKKPKLQKPSSSSADDKLLLSMLSGDQKAAMLRDYKGRALFVQLHADLVDIGYKLKKRQTFIILDSDGQVHDPDTFNIDIEAEVDAILDEDDAILDEDDAILDEDDAILDEDDDDPDEDEEPDPAQLIEYIREIAGENDWTQEDLAKKMRVSQPTIANWMAGNTENPRPKSIRKMFRFIDKYGDE